MRKILLAVAAAATLLTLTGCSTTTTANSAPVNGGFGPYVAGPYETAAIQYVTLSLY